MSLFLRLLEDDDKALALRTALRAVAAGEPDPRVFEADPDAFALVPGAPFAYWISPSAQSAFSRLPNFEGERRTAKCGAGTLDDFRFLRLDWEVPVSVAEWVSFAKGGAFGRYYADLYLRLAWANAGREIQCFVEAKVGSATRKIQAQPWYFRPGLTWPRRTNGLSFRAMPAGCIFADKGPAAFVDGDDPESLLALCALVNSAPFGALVALQLARTELAQSYEVGLIQQTPVPPLTTDDGRPTTHAQTLSTLAHRAWSLKHALDTATETSHAFRLPALLQVPGEDLAARAAAWSARVQATEAALADIQADIDDCCFALYGIDGEDRRRIEVGPGGTPDAAPTDPGEDGGEDDEGPGAVADPAPLTALLVSWALGVACGRFDLRLATGQRAAPAAPGPFDPLPVCPPGQLQNAQALPAGADDLPAAYPVDIPWDGILVDDPGHERDLAARSRAVFDIVFADGADGAWREAAEILAGRGNDLRAWFARSFFADHIKRCSKSRRKAPIYWQLATPSAGYSVWLNYHRFTRDTLYKVLNDSMTPKLQHEERKLMGLVQGAGGTPTANQRKEIAEQERFVEELRTFREEVGLVAPLWNPDLNDGVIINFAPLWRLVPQHRAWQKECKDCWGRLTVGDYDWAHLAMHLWPERVVPKCAMDRSLAIAHGLEAVFWEESSVVSRRSSAQDSLADDRRLTTDDVPPGKWLPLTVAQAEVDRLIAERTSAAVKDALTSLLEAPAPATGSGGGRKSSGRGPVRRVPTAPKTDNAGAGSGPATGSAAPDPVMLDAVKQAIAAAQGATSKSEVLAATGLTDAQWNAAINALLAAGTVTKTGAGRGTRYQLSAPD
ncbi:hypothetical protein [Candidatus Thiodictyon syntrophicum]|uniref:Uncharacterized protein n=1 Tax=Candidatus Thiodictyon syntrophicum TaxID=1166950 RepID=A0A2K8UAM8_9GAMM|nr:hypothetical protein [Candidatus Thiodictyon syntrophicum]AUB82640.1 hypothetical protein THSYN_17950 [Candidatus Thiodictyon syntrophicum]